MADDRVSVTVNGESRQVATSTTIADIVAVVSTAGSGIAVAVNDEVVPRGGWPSRRLHDRDRVEILTAVQGG
ncbi:MAG TPA: sulfur carrier protein ThiS [Actinomycetes bacterium]|jgi:sulfur carrier protein